MSKLPVFYSSISVLNRDTHRDLKVLDGGRAVTFSRGSHLIPALADEFPAAARELPIVFVMSEDRPTPVFVVGLETEKNAFVNDAGKWNARYVPAYLRRYPFILGNVANQDPVLCMDGGYVSADDGERLFTETGENTPYLTSAIEFANRYADSAKRADTFVDLLVKYDLLRDIAVQVSTTSKGDIVLQGLRAVNEEKLNTLDDATFKVLRMANALPFIYSHLLSLSAFTNLSEKSSASEPAAA